MAPSRASSSWDPILLISQIVAMQCLHYLTLAVLIPPSLALLADPVALEYEGGVANVGMLMDWREMAGRPTFRRLHGEERWHSFAGAWTGGKMVAEPAWHVGAARAGRADPLRGWVLAVCWLLASGADIYYLYAVIRRPRLILDFVLTLLFNHLVLTTYYSAALPTSLFFWAVVLAGGALMIVVAEQLCVKREMNEGLVVATAGIEEEQEEMELGGMRRD
ncbi:hypothetical protein DENSPDRAFT_836031 [Dentipellis sp. KUC8613]|nr:hypothetical protein DENSPDRAFT_836031 [Dentipellis sp. KUC8613]